MIAPKPKFQQPKCKLKLFQMYNPKRCHLWRDLLSRSRFDYFWKKIMDYKKVSCRNILFYSSNFYKKSILLVCDQYLWYLMSLGKVCSSECLRFQVKQGKITLTKSAVGNFNPIGPGKYFERLRKLRFPKNLMIKSFFDCCRQCKYLHLERPSGIEFEMPIQKRLATNLLSRVGQKGPPDRA